MHEPEYYENLGHALWKDGEDGLPDAICDGNGEVVLGLCKVCNAGESELDEECLSRRMRLGMTDQRTRLIWATPGGDDLVAYMARVSNSKATIRDPSERLIGYLLRNHHWSPFEMVNMCIELHTERDISAQILRHSKEHRFQEFSTRYSKVEELRYGTECRFQDSKNRQNSFTVEEASAGGLPIDAAQVSSTNEQLSVDQIVSYFDALVNESKVRSEEAYNWMLEHGVAKEVARRVLPFGLTPTKMYVNSNVRGWMHYLSERTKPGVQKEHRELALQIELVFQETYPLVFAAWKREQGRTELREKYADTVETFLSMLEDGEYPDFLDMIEKVMP